MSRRALAVFVLAAALSACSGEVAVLSPAGAQAGRIGELWSLYFPILTAVWVLVMLALGLALFRGRRGETDRTAGPPVPEAMDPLSGPQHPPVHAFLQPSKATERRLTVVVGTAVAVTLAILVVLLVTSFRTGRALATFGQDASLQIEVVGNQWWWKIRYTDPDPSKIVDTANELHIPVGRPVKLKLSSSDVIHSFWIPRLHGKRDLIPGTVSVSVIQADAPGEYTGQCAEFCGLQHALMGLTVIAQPEEEFQAWLRAQRQPAAPPATPQQQRGHDLFVQGPCVLCHTIAGTVAGSQAGPDLTHLASRKTLGAGAMPNTRGHLAGWILDPQGVKPGVRMPPNPLPPEDLHALLAYLEALK